MRSTSFVFSSLVLVLAGASAGCGGSAQEPAKEPGTPVAAPSAAPTGPDPGPPAQTTTSEGLTGGTGTKLPPAASSAPAGGSSEPGRSPQEIGFAVKARRDDFRACYDNALKTHAGIEGDIHLRWIIDPKGAVTDVKIDGAFVDVTMNKCLETVVKSIKFPESPKGMETKAHYPFNFNPRSGGKIVAPSGGK